MKQLIPNNLRRFISRCMTNHRGWRTNRKIVVIESDDWGSIRMPSRQVYERCLKAGYRVDQIPYERYDSLASEDDLEVLFELITSIKDQYGNHPVITANTITANPDFEKIQGSGFKEYHYEYFTETLKKYPKHSGCFDLWKEGMEQSIFHPQYHGREHLNVSMFINALNRGDKDALFGFRNHMPGIIPHGNTAKGNGYVETLRYTDHSDKMDKLKNIIEGTELFEHIFKYRSLSFIPPNYIWSSDFDTEIAQKGIHYYQGNRKMKEPNGNGGFNLVRRKLGEKNSFGQLYLIRNALFEPALSDGKSDVVDNCLLDIKSAFLFNKPAIICSHRLNYIGFIDESNRDKNLKLLKSLLLQIINKWPDVEFMTSDQLGNEIIKT